MQAELIVSDVLNLANDELKQRSLQPVGRRTLDYWISIGLIQHPTRKGRAGRGLFPEDTALHVICIRELQQRFNFMLADISRLLRNGSRLADVSSLMAEVETTYGVSLLPLARQYACSNPVGASARDEVANLFIAIRVAEGDEELGVDEVATIIGTDNESAMKLARSGELPSHGELQPRFLRSEILEWKGRDTSHTAAVFADMMGHLIDLANEMHRIDSLAGLPDRSREWLTYWIGVVDAELWRLRRLCHEADMRQRMTTERTT